MGKADQGSGEDKRKARDLRRQADEAFAAGDYRRTAVLDEEISALVSRGDLGKAARRERELLKVDPRQLYVGLFGLTLYILAWIISL